MRRIITARDRFGVPAILSIMLATILSSLASLHGLVPGNVPTLDIMVKLVVAIPVLYITQHFWGQWMNRRTNLVMMKGYRRAPALRASYHAKR